MCTVQIQHVGIIFVDHGGVMSMVKIHYVRFEINIMKLFGCFLLILKWMSTFEMDEYFFFVLLQGCRCFFAINFIFSVKFFNKPNMGK